MSTVLSFLFLAGAVWCAIPVFTAFIINIGNVTGIIVFTLLYLWARFPREASRMFHALHPALRFLTAGITILIALLTVIISCMMVSACMKKPAENSTVIVLGCGVYGERPSLMLVERLQAAERYLNDNPESSAVLSGGQGEGEDISEAEAMYRWMKAHGIAESRLYREEKSMSTRENLKYSLEIIRENSLPEQIAVVSNEFHLLRARMIAEKLGLEVTAIPAPTAWWLFAAYYIRELYGVIYQIIL